MFFSARALPEEDELIVDGVRLCYRIQVSARRRTLCLRLFPDGQMQVVVPRYARLTDIRRFVGLRGGWIERQRAALRTQPLRILDPCAHGATLPLLGTTLVLHHQVCTTKRPVAVRHGDTLVVPASTSQQARPLVEAWYRRAAHGHVHQRMAHYAPLVGRAPARITIRGQKTRWGSCSSRASISINWRLMQAAPDIMDYVIVHELCHLLQANHAPRFWREVARVLPDYEARRRRLREFGRSIVL